MRSMVEGGVLIRNDCVAPTTPSTIAFGDGPPPRAGEDLGHSTVTLFARLRGWSTSVPLATATW